MTRALAATPRFHYAPERGRFGDPKPFYWDGQYHVFFQNSPAADEGADERAIFAGMRWGHVVSDDLLCWERLPDALTPTPGTPDAHGCWTGSVLRANDAFHIFYTGVGDDGGVRQTVCHATSDDLVTWRKDPANPLVEPQRPFSTVPASAWRDPQVVPAPDGGWEMLLTADLPGAPEALRGCVARLKSPDLSVWDVVGLEHHPKSVHRCECPDTFPLGDRHVLLYSDFGVQVRMSDDPRGPWERPDVPQIDDFRYYAAKTTADETGRRTMFGFLFGRAAEEGFPTDSSPWEWGGAMALPREIGVSNGHFSVRPAQELDALRAEPLSVAAISPLEIGSWEMGSARGSTLEESGAREARMGAPTATEIVGRRQSSEDELSLRLMGEHPLQFELVLSLDLGPEDAAGLLLGCDPDLTRGYRLDVDRAARRISLERMLPHQNPSSKVLQQLALPRDLPEPLPMRLFLDANILEVFVADRLCFSGRLYGMADASNWWGLVTPSAQMRVAGLRAWRLAVPNKRVPLIR